MTDYIIEGFTISTKVPDFSQIGKEPVRPYATAHSKKAAENIVKGLKILDVFQLRTVHYLISRKKK